MAITGPALGAAASSSASGTTGSSPTCATRGRTRRSVARSLRGDRRPVDSCARGPGRSPRTRRGLPALDALAGVGEQLTGVFDPGVAAVDGARRLLGGGRLGCRAPARDRARRRFRRRRSSSVASTACASRIGASTSAASRTVTLKRSNSLPSGPRTNRASARTSLHRGTSCTPSSDGRRVALTQLIERLDRVVEAFATRRTRHAKARRGVEHVGQVASFGGLPLGRQTVSEGRHDRSPRTLGSEWTDRVDGDPEGSDDYQVKCDSSTTVPPSGETCRSETACEFRADIQPAPWMSATSVPDRHPPSRSNRQRGDRNPPLHDRRQR